MNRRKFIKSTSLTGLCISMAGCINNDDINTSPSSNTHQNDSNIDLANSSSPIVTDINKRPMRGSEDARYSLISIDEPSCPFCREFMEETYPELESELINTGQLKYYSLLRNNDTEQWSNASVHYLYNLYKKTNQSASYFELLNYYYENQVRITGESIYDKSNEFISSNNSVNINEIESNVKNKKYNDELIEIQDTQDMVGLTITPSFALFDGDSLITELLGAYEADVFFTLIQD